MEIQHEISVKLGKLICDKNETKENRLWVTYGIEVILNELSKFCVALIIAIILHLFWEVLFSGVILLILRGISGGRHFKNNICCFIASDLSLICPVLIATNYKLDCRYKWLIFSIIGLFLIIWTPYERKQSLNIWNKLIKKLIVISVFCVGIFLEVIFWGEKTEGEITGMVTMIECFSIFPKSKER